MSEDKTAADAGLSDPEALSYEQARDQLRAVVQSLESGTMPLEDTLALWQRGELLAARCKQILDQAAAILETVESADGEPSKLDGASESNNLN